SPAGLGQARIPILPIGVMLRGIGIYLLERPTMNLQVGLAITVQIAVASGNRARDRLLENGRSNGFAIPLHLLGHPYIHGQDAHHATPQITSTGLSSNQRVEQDRSLGPNSPTILNGHMAPD